MIAPEKQALADIQQEANDARIKHLNDEVAMLGVFGLINFVLIIGVIIIAGFVL